MISYRTFHSEQRVNMNNHPFQFFFRFVPHVDWFRLTMHFVFPFSSTRGSNSGRTESAGYPLSCKSTHPGCRHSGPKGEGNTVFDVTQRVAQPAPRCLRPCACVDDLCSSTGRSHRYPSGVLPGGSVREGRWPRESLESCLRSARRGRGKH